MLLPYLLTSYLPVMFHFPLCSDGNLTFQCINVLGFSCSIVGIALQRLKICLEGGIPKTAIYQTLPMGSFFEEKVPFDIKSIENEG